MTLSWDHYRSFLAVVRQGSLSGAARELELTQPTLGRHVGELEAALSSPLFVRSPGGLAPTEAALALVPHAEAMASAADALVRAASGESAEPKGVVRLTASEVVGVEVLPPILAAFHEGHPHIVIELAVSNRNQDLLRRDADIAVRMARPTQGALSAKRIGRIDVGLYAHKRYLKRHGMPTSLEDLAQHTIIGFDRDTSSLRSVSGSFPVTRNAFALRSDNDHAQIAALRAGFGIAAIQAPIAARDTNLIAVMPEHIRFGLEIWLVMHEDLRMNRRVRLLFDHLAGALARYAAIK